MHVPFGWVSLLTGVCGGVMYASRTILGSDPDFALLAASVAAWVAGWIACVSVPQIERRIGNARQSPGGDLAASPPDA